jgi:sugar lactone lactonase YvrE
VRAGRLANVLLIAALATGAACGSARAATAPIVSTLAGSGRAGATDGPALSATFDVPAALAAGNDGAIYVADTGAHDVRRIVNGRVDTLAGRPGAAIGPDVRAGGYADGPAQTAQFDRPVGIAVGNDGAVYVADAGNHCIRKIAGGIVTTFAGSRKVGVSDGEGRNASFTNLKGLAIDGDGNLYAADYGVGIRRITPQGAVTTLNLPSDQNAVVAVAARGAGTNLILAYADADALHVFTAGHDDMVRFDDQREPETSELLVGSADSLAILNQNTLVVTDVATDAVRFVRMPAPPYIADHMTRALAGGLREGSDVAGGYADGPAERALVNVPLGVALAPDGSVVVADAGNRRIRKIVGVDARESILPDLSNFDAPPDDYRITLVGNSYLFYNVLWPESIPGTLESGLARDAAQVGLPRRPRVTAFRVDGLTSSAQQSLILNYLANGQTNLVVLLVNYFTDSDARSLEYLARHLKGANTKFMLVYTPQGYQVSPLEYSRALVSDDADQFALLHENATRAEGFYQALGIRSLLLFEPMEQAELAQNRRSFFYGANHHLTVFGAQWVASRLLDDIERWKPWQ